MEIPKYYRATGWWMTCWLAFIQPHAFSQGKKGHFDIEQSLLQPNPFPDSAVFLTLADGTQKEVTGLKDHARIAVQGMTVIENDGKDGGIVYRAEDFDSVPAGINTVRTGRSKPFFIRLANGIEVHLNYLSALQFRAGHYECDTLYLQGEGDINIPRTSSSKGVWVAFGKNAVFVRWGCHADITAWPEEGFTDVAVLAGRAEITSNRTFYGLQAGDLLRTGAAGNSLNNACGGYECYWNTSRWYFRSNGIQVIDYVHRLAKWLHLKVYNPFSLQGGGICAGFSAFADAAEECAEITLIASGRLIATVKDDTIVVMPSSRSVQPEDQHQPGKILHE